MNIPFVSLAASNKLIRSEILAEFETCFDEAWYVLGKRVENFEKEYAQYNQVSDCIGVSNGLDALHIALKILNIKTGDEVIVPSNTYIASALAISYVGAKPVFVEPDVSTFNLNAENVRAAITMNTKAIMPVHLYGQSCEMDKIMQIAKENLLSVIEDNAQSQGATFKNKMTGSWGTVNGTSFYPGKNLGAYGDAGAITTNDAGIAAKAKVLRNYGSERKYYNEVIGYNMRLDEIQAGFLSIKLKHLDLWTKQRQEIASWYDKALASIDEIQIPAIHPEATHVYHLYVIKCKRRDDLQLSLSASGVGTMIHYPIPPHLQNAYSHLGFGTGDFPIAEEIANTCLSLPLWPGMTNEMVTQIAEVIKKFYTSDMGLNQCWNINK